MNQEQLEQVRQALKLGIQAIDRDLGWAQDAEIELQEALNLVEESMKEKN